MDKSPKLLDKVRELMRLKHFSPKPEESYLYWIRKYLRFHHLRLPREMGRLEVEAFLTHLAVNEHVAASTSNQAFSALLFLSRDVLGIELEAIDAVRANRKKNVPTVLTKDEVRAVIACLSGSAALMAQLMMAAACASPNVSGCV